MKNIEHERSKWTESYDGKVVMIEQLQRELAHTVEALHVEKSVDKWDHDDHAHTGSSRSGLREGNVTRGISSSPSTTSHLGERSRFIPERHHQQGQPRHLPDHFQQSTLHHPTHSEEPPLSRDTHSDDSLARENSALKDRISTLLHRESEYAQETVQLKLKIEEMTSACRDTEGKLRFRTQQVVFVGWFVSGNVGMWDVM